MLELTSYKTYPIINDIHLAILKAPCLEYVPFTKTYASLEGKSAGFKSAKSPLLWVQPSHHPQSWIQMVGLCHVCFASPQICFHIWT